MKRYRYLIERHEEVLNNLDAQLNENFDRRDQSAFARREWQLAAKRFREYRSEVDELVDCCIAQGIEDDNELRRFAFSFVECDPYYFRSGYTLSRLLRKIKWLSLFETEKTMLQNLILKRIDTKALRNFRDICRLIPIIETVGFHSAIASRARSSNPDVKHRAELAASYFPMTGNFVATDL
ncbi:MAG: hypothetical protein KUG58_11540 [Marinosulfonomonas sp.]|nr:hypothetical protein [Marinosulfonomonas sp.]